MVILFAYLDTARRLRCSFSQLHDRHISEIQVKQSAIAFETLSPSPGSETEPKFDLVAAYLRIHFNAACVAAALRPST
jgi:hypothetical protein